MNFDQRLFASALDKGYKIEIKEVENLVFCPNGNVFGINDFKFMVSCFEKKTVLIYK